MEEILIKRGYTEKQAKSAATELAHIDPRLKEALDRWLEDETETDWYTVEVTQVDDNYKPLKDTMTYFYVDSCGNVSDEFNISEIDQFVLGFLFKPQLQTVIQGF